jgi:hypothetical protein
VEQHKGTCCICPSLQAEGEATLLPRLWLARGWGANLQPTTGRPGNPPVGAAEARQRRTRT